MPGRWGTRITAVCYIVISAYICAEAIDFPHGGGTFPLFAAGSSIVLCVIMFAGAFPEACGRIRDALLRSGPVGVWIAKSLRGGAEEDDIVFDFSYGRLKPLVVCAVTVAYVLAMFELGYFAATVVFMIAAPVMVGVRRPIAIGVTLLILLPAMYAFFILFLQANLPKGVLL